MFVDITTRDFDQNQLFAMLVADKCTQSIGGTVCFTGLVREFGELGKLDAIELEHYPQMAEQQFWNILHQAQHRFDLANAGVVHRVGRLAAFEQIVWVGCAAPHRQTAFNGAMFIMDTLKSNVPIWKKEVAQARTSWVEAKSSDLERLKQWK